MKNSMLMNGWGIVHDENGTHWVYIPLWDPIKFNKVGRALFSTLVIKQHLSAITNEKVKSTLREIVKEQSQIVAKGFVGAMDDGDGEFCGTYPHTIHIPNGGGIGNDPENPVYRQVFGKEVSANMNAKAAITMLGKVLNNKKLIEASNQI
jgi:hypothetical protein